MLAIATAESFDTKPGALKMTQERISRKFTRKQVELESTLENPLVILAGKVYNLAEFLESHPGGDDLILEYHGQDVTEIMHGDLHDHSDNAYQIAQEYLIGYVVEQEIASSSNPTKPRISVKTGSKVYHDQKELTEPHIDFSDRNAEHLPTIDFNRAIFPQIWNLNLTKDQYVEFIHIPHHLKFTARFFDNPFMELLSRNPWWVVPLVWVPVIVYLLTFRALEMFSFSSGKIFDFSVHSVPYSQTGWVSGAYITGIILWSLMEYTLHRFLFHVDDALPNNHLAMMAHFTLHGVHHFLPMDKMRLVFPPVMATPIVLFFNFVLTTVAGHRMGSALLAGAVTGYICYDLFHYFLHHGKVSRWLKQQQQHRSVWDLSSDVSSHLSKMKSYHMDHHYKNFHLGYGITSKIWDRVFHTLGSPTPVPSPLKSKFQ